MPFFRLGIVCWFATLVSVLGSVCRGGEMSGVSKSGVSQSGVPQSGAVQDALTRLMDDHWKVRQGAQEQLVSRGEDVQEALESALSQVKDAEAAARLSAALMQIRENRIVGMSMITLDLKDAPLATILAEVARQGRAPLLTDPPNLLNQKSFKPLSLKVDHRPYWEVVQSLCAQHEFELMSVTQHNQDVGLGLSRGSSAWLDKPTVLTGPLMIQAETLTRISTVHLRRPRDVAQEFTISLVAFAEPKLKVLDFSGNLKLLEVVDDLGSSLIPPADGAVAANVEMFGNSREGGTSRWEIGATLSYPAKPGSRISRFRASTSLVVESQSASFETPLSGRSVSYVAGGLNVTVSTADVNKLELAVEREGRSDAQWSVVSQQLLLSEAQLVDESGRVVGRSQSGADPETTPDNQRMELKLRFNSVESGDVEGNQGRRKNTNAVKVVWRFPLETRTLTLPFEFRDLPMPR